MYSRDFGIKSEGQLYNLEREYNESRLEPTEQKEAEDCGTVAEKPKGGLSFLREMKVDDLLLIGIALLLLVDSDGENDIFLVALAVLLLF